MDSCAPPTPERTLAPQERFPLPTSMRWRDAGVTFTNAYTAAVCSPSRAMITTGQYGSRFGYALNISSDTTAIDQASTVQGLPTQMTTVWERMQGLGYQTAAVGKWHLGQHADGGGQLGNRPENQGRGVFSGTLGWIPELYRGGRDRQWGAP